MTNTLHILTSLVNLLQLRASCETCLSLTESCEMKQFLVLLSVVAVWIGVSATVSAQSWIDPADTLKPYAPKMKGQKSVMKSEPKRDAAAAEEPVPATPPRRKKIYYPASQIEENLRTKGKEWMTADDSIEYKGYYHRYATGEVFTKKEWDPVYSRQLIPYIPKK
jgi:hypothetical protein